MTHSLTATALGARCYGTLTRHPLQPISLRHKTTTRADGHHSTGEKQVYALRGCAVPRCAVFAVICMYTCTYATRTVLTRALHTGPFSAFLP